MLESIAVGDRMLLGMQDYNFAQNLNHFYPNFAQILPKFAQICPKNTRALLVSNL